LKCSKHQLLEKQDGYQSDLNGLKKFGEETFRKLEVKKDQLHQKTDIVHMLNLEMREQSQEVENTGELKNDQDSKQTHLL